MTNAKINTSKGFTLIELLVVIAIIGVLAAVVLLALNPAELLRRSRDTTRLNDMVTLRKAIDASIASESAAALPATCTGGATPACTTASATPDRTVAGAGWLPYNVAQYVSTLPVDPNNNTTRADAQNNQVLFVYQFGVNGSSYELRTRLESTNNAPKLAADGGSEAAWYEVGTDLTILQ